MRILLAILLTATTAFAQDRAGNDTPGEWRITHHQAYGLWDTMCDERVTGAQTEQRCYLRYVDVFSPRPNFAAQFAFITPDNRIEFGIENGTAFRKDGFRLEQNGATVWSFRNDPCLFGGSCAFTDEPAAELLAQMNAADRFIFDFVDRHGMPTVLDWDMTRFSEAHRDMLDQAAQRGL